MPRIGHFASVSMAMVMTLSLLPLGRNSAAVPAPGDSAAQIRALELAHNEAIARGDVPAVERMTADDFTYITPRGFLINKKRMLIGVAGGAFEYEYREIYDLKIRLYGDTAVVTGRSLHTVQKDGRDLSDAYRYTRVYVRQSGQWRAVAWQVTVEDEYELEESGQRRRE